MVENRRGLGRGLSALLDEADAGALTNTGANTGPAVRGAREIPIELIHANPEQPRRHFDETELAGLVDSIRDKGLLQPILVRNSPKTPGEFEIVAGERRWRAAQRAGLAEIPALVRDLADGLAYEIAIIENVQRENLNAMEEAQAYHSLMKRLGYTQDQTAAKVGKSRSHVANTLRLLQLPDSVQEHLLFGRLTAGHARAILASNDPERLAERIVERGLSVREAEALSRLQPAGAKKTSGPRKPGKDADTQALEVDLEDVLGMSVDINHRGGQGDIRISYQTLEQLDDLCRRLTRS
jgi:ParB family transcriptional regulator, chromosome partitioning protein